MFLFPFANQGRKIGWCAPNHHNITTSFTYRFSSFMWCDQCHWAPVKICRLMKNWRKRRRSNLTEAHSFHSISRRNLFFSLFMWWCPTNGCQKLCHLIYDQVASEKKITWERTFSKSCVKVGVWRLPTYKDESLLKRDRIFKVNGFHSYNNNKTFSFAEI